MCAEVHPLRILIVEDALLTAEQLRHVVEESPFEVDITAVTTEDDAVSEYAHSAFDLAIVDLRLAQGSGFGVVRHLMAGRQKPVIAVITNYTLPQYRDYALLLGARYFLDKCVIDEMLPKILRTVRSERAAR